MGDRHFPFEENSICDTCGAVGAWDIYGDYICQKCMDGELVKDREFDPFDVKETDDEQKTKKRNN